MQSNQALIDQYLVWLADNKGRADATIVKYRGYLVRLDEHLENKPILDTGRETLELFTGPVAVKSGLSGRSRRALVAAVRGFYRWSVREGLISNNPAEDVPYPKTPNHLPLAMTLENAERLTWAPDLSTFIGLRDAAMFAVMIGCGLRVSGLTQLNEEDITSVITGGYTRLLLRVKEKGGKERLMPVPREAQMLLQGYIGHKDLDNIDRRTPEGNTVLFVTTNNRSIVPVDYIGEARRIKAKGVWKRIRWYGERLKIPTNQLRPHALRHLYGAELAEEDVDLLERQALLGHADPKSTEVYTHLATRKLFNTVDKANPLGKISTPVTKLLEALT